MEILFIPPVAISALAAMATLALFGLASYFGWQSLTPGSRNFNSALSILMFSASLGALYVTADLVMTDVSTRSTQASFESFIVAIALLIGAFCSFGYGLATQKIVHAAGSALGLSVAATLVLGVAMTRSSNDVMDFSNGIFFILTLVAFALFLYTYATVKIKAYGERRYEAGKLAGLDTSDAKKTAGIPTA